MNLQEIRKWLELENEAELEELWQRADQVRQDNVGSEVHLRGLIEISNYCTRNCSYCGLRRDLKHIERYRMTEDEVMACAHQAVEFNYGTVVMQAGEDYGLQADWLANIIRRIKSETPLAITLSLGERPDEELELFRRAGADRYLLRFETSNLALYDKIHPPLPGKKSDRIEILQKLRELGYEVGSGVMIGIPGQSYDDLARDIEVFGRLDLDMIGVGPFIAHPDTPLGQMLEEQCPGLPDQVPNTEAMTYRVVALTRLMCPKANIPSTTALATLNTANGRELGLSRGANVVMPNLTPVQYRELYSIYPAKACLSETAEQCNNCMRRRIESLGRTLGVGRGDSPNRLQRV